jgi:nucleoside-diphosphate-sugar epimerase
MLAGFIANQLRQSDVRIAVTGAGGWIGQTSLHVLADALGEAFQRRVFAFGSRERDLSLAGGRMLRCARLDDLPSLPRGRYLFLHCAFLTKERVAQMSNEAYVQANRAITVAVEAAVRRVETVGLFLPSSGAVYRADRSLETDFSANPYGAMKYADERHFAALSRELDFRLAAVRVFNLAGPFINKIGSYALASILADILHGGPIVLRAAQPVIRSYIHIEDLIALALADLLDDSRPAQAPFDTAGEVEIEVGDLALRCARLLECSDIAVQRPPQNSNVANRYVGDPAVMRRLARHYAIELASLDTQILDTARYLRQAL